MTRRPSTDEPAATGPAALRRTYTHRDCGKRVVLVAVSAADVWSVYDIPEAPSPDRTGWLVEQLRGFDDRLDSALSLMTEYVADQDAFHNGEREDSPLPKPPTIALTAIHQDTARARRVIGDHSKDDQPAARKAA